MRTPIDDGARTDPGADRHIDHVAAAATRAVSPFAIGGGMAIMGQPDRPGHAGGQPVAQGKVGETPDRRGGEGKPRLGVQRSRRAKPKRPDRVGRPRPQRPERQFGELLHDRIGALLRRRRSLGTVADPPIPVHDSCPHAGAAEVECQGQRRAHRPSAPARAARPSAWRDPARRRPASPSPQYRRPPHRDRARWSRGYRHRRRGRSVFGTGAARSDRQPL